MPKKNSNVKELSLKTSAIFFTALKSTFNFHVKTFGGIRSTGASCLALRAM